MKEALAILLAAGLVSGVCAGTLKGTVTDEGDHPMQGVTVSVWGKDSVKGVTDARGNFKLTSDELQPGNRYAVKAVKEGWMMAQNSFGTEMYEDEEDMEPLEIVMKKEDVEPETPAVEHKASGEVKETVEPEEENPAEDAKAAETAETAKAEAEKPAAEAPKAEAEKPAAEAPKAEAEKPAAK